MRGSRCEGTATASVAGGVARALGRVLFLAMGLCALGSAAAATRPPGRTVRVGCYYFPGWYCADRWAPIVEYGGREPVLGWYRDDLPAVQDWHIRQATQHGISFWVFDWYYDHRSGTILEHNAALDRGFLHASLRGKMDFALMWCNEEAGQPGYTEAELLRLVQTIGKRYLSQPNYLRAADGRAVLVVSRPDRLIARFGSGGARAMLKTMSDAARPWGGIFFTCVSSPTATNLRAMREAGFNACTLYCYADQGLAPGELEGAYDAILPAVEPVWRGGTLAHELPLIPCVSPGWDSRPWYGDRGLARTGSTPERFGRMCRELKRYVDPQLGLAVVGTWNEFGEGTYVEPTRERGCAYLDAMQHVFFPGSPRHGLLAPSPVARARLGYADVPAHLEEQVARQGGNLVINPGFERDWGWVHFDGSPAVYARGVVHTGRRSLLLSKAKGGAKSQALAPGVPWPSRFTNHVDLDRGRTYRISAWVYGRARVALALFDRAEGWLGRYQPVAEGGTAGAWRKLDATVTIADPEAAAFDLEVVPTDDTIYVDDVGVWRTLAVKP